MFISHCYFYFLFSKQDVDIVRMWWVKLLYYLECMFNLYFMYWTCVKLYMYCKLGGAEEHGWLTLVLYFMYYSCPVFMFCKCCGSRTVLFVHYVLQCSWGLYSCKDLLYYCSCVVLYVLYRCGGCITGWLTCSGGPCCTLCTVQVWRL